MTSRPSRPPVRSVTAATTTAVGSRSSARPRSSRYSRSTRWSGQLLDDVRGRGAVPTPTSTRRTTWRCRPSTACMSGSVQSSRSAANGSSPTLGWSAGSASCSLIRTRRPLRGLHLVPRARRAWRGRRRGCRCRARRRAPRRLRSGGGTCRPAARSASSASTPRCRATLTMANSTSPSSSATAASSSPTRGHGAARRAPRRPWPTARSTSGQSKPTLRRLARRAAGRGERRLRRRDPVEHRRALPSRPA